MALFHIGNKSFELVYENRSGWNFEAFRERYSEVLDRYDYIIGDWGYNQLRLRGFFRDQTPKAAKDSVYSSIPDYINEYCNFGCAYFLLEKKHSNKQDAEPGSQVDDELQIPAVDDASQSNSPNENDTPNAAPSATGKSKRSSAQQKQQQAADAHNSSEEDQQDEAPAPKKQKSKRDFYYRRGGRNRKNQRGGEREAVTAGTAGTGNNGNES